MASITKGLIPLIGGGALTLALPQDEAEAAAVYSKDGRRLLDLLNKAADGTLKKSEPVFKYYGEIPEDVIKSLQKEDSNFVSKKLASEENDIWHYWNKRHNAMTNEQIEDAIEALTTGTKRYHTKGNPPYENGIGVITEGKAYNGSLLPGIEYTRIYQVNPLNEKRLLAKTKSLSSSTDGSAVHPVATPSNDGVLPQRAISADVELPLKVSEKQIPVNSFTEIPAALGGTTGASAAVWPMQAADGRLIWPADMPGYRNTEPGLETPIIDPVDIVVAPVGVRGLIGKAAAMAAEPAIAYGTDSALDGILGLFQRNKRNGGGGV